MFKPKCKNGELFKTAAKRKNFVTSDNSNWSWDLCSIAQANDDNFSSCRMICLSEKYDEALLRKMELTLQKAEIMGKLKLIILLY